MPTSLTSAPTGDPTGDQTGAPRVILFTGKGGVGAASVAAGTAALAAAGHPTQVPSVDPAHCLGDALGIQAGLFGCRVDGVVADRAFSSEVADDRRAGWVVAHDEVLAEVEESVAGLPVWRSDYRPVEPVGVDVLVDLATRRYDGADPLALPGGPGPFRVTRSTAGATLHLTLALDTRAEVGLARHGDELAVSVGSYRRLLSLPAGLARLEVAGAEVGDGELRVRFAHEAAAGVVGDAVRAPGRAGDRTGRRGTSTGAGGAHRPRRRHATGEGR